MSVSPRKQYSRVVELTNHVAVVGYIIFLLPGNVCMRAVSPPYLVGGAALLYGAFLVGMSAAESYATVLSMRILIGASQAFTQGLGVYFTMWYKRDEVATRSGVFHLLSVHAAVESH